MNRRLTCSALPSERPRGIRAVDRPSMRDPSGGPVLVMRRASNCISALAVAALAATIGPIELVAQVPGRNVNMVSGTTLPDGDPFLQRQNEPSVAASTRNPQHLLAGANDYRTVDLPGLPDDLENGDAWLGNGQRIAAGNVYIVFTVFNGPGAAAASESDRPENILRDKDDDQKDGERKDSDDEERLHGRIMTTLTQVLRIQPVKASRDAVHSESVQSPLSPSVAGRRWESGYGKSSSPGTCNQTSNGSVRLRANAVLIRHEGE